MTSDPYFGLQYYLKNAVTRFGVPVDINVEPVWSTTMGTPSVRVAVIDAGIDGSFDSAPYDEFDNLGAGYDSPTTRDNCTNSGPWDPFQNDNHGTAVAGIIKATHNTIGIAGVAPNVTLLSARIFCNITADPLTSASAMETRDAINWAWFEQGARVINNSWSRAPNEAITHAILSAAVAGLGTLVVHSAGNNSDRDIGITGPVTYPANLVWTIAVGAINSTGYITNYSNEGPEIDIVAPSGHYDGCALGDVVTLDLQGLEGCSDGPGGELWLTKSFSGTSAAAPQVSGAIALLLSYDATLTRSNVLQRLYDNADSWGSFPNQVGEGKLNVYNAMFPPVPPLVASISGPDLVKPTDTCTWFAIVSGGSGPTTYEWRLNGPVVSTSSSYTAALGFGFGAFLLELVVTRGSEWDDDELRILTDFFAPSC